MRTSNTNALIISGVYALFSGCWILFSDLAVEAIVTNAHEITWLQTLKGWFFVAVTACFLYMAIFRFSNRIEEAFKLDGMTGLLSHKLFKLQLANLIESRKTDEKIIVAIMDINNFKELNAKYGFEAADRLITEIAEEMSDFALPNTLICRLPPDQFMLARAYSGFFDAESRLANYADLPSRIAKPLGLEASCSIGVAYCPTDGSNAKQLMDAAVEALNEAKTSGSSVQYHDMALSERAQAKRKRIEELRKAIKNDALSLMYQPKYKLNSLEACGLEVLVRWNHPEEGFISPAEFVPLAEEYGLTNAITRFVIRRAASELPSTNLLGSKIKHVAINVSATEFNNPQDIEELLALIKENTALAPYLRVEITETATLTDIKQSSEIILKLRENGLGISIDDFGTGYTSLAMLKDLTIDELKIDRSFVSGLCDNGRSTPIVGAIIGMAKSFDINVVGEGVETEDQLNRLREMGCDEVQGFLLGKPMNVEGLAEHLNATSPTHG